MEEISPDLRLKWAKHIEYILSSIGYTVGLMNVWRFPYVCYENGGAAFLIPYVILLLTVGLPIYFMEAILGQFPSYSPYPAFSLVPCTKGVGLTQVVISFLVGSYYIVILVWASVYFYFGLRLEELPWTSCTDTEWGQDRNTCYVRSKEPLHPPMCSTKEDKNTTCKNYTSAAVQFFNIYVLEKKPETNIGNLGPILPQLALLLGLMWVIVYVCVSKGIQTTGKIVYVTAIFPYFVLGYFCLIGFSLDGASEGIKFLYGDVEKITQPKVWQAALTQMFLSCSIGLGGVTMYASFNEFENKLFRDSLIVVFMDFITSILAAVAVFSVIGFYSKYLDMPFDKTFDTGVALMFQVLPGAVSVMPYPKIGVLLLMSMVFMLGIDTQFVLVETVIVTIEDVWPTTRKYRYLVGVCVCSTSMLCGLAYVTRGGILALQLTDFFLETTLTYTVFWELIAVCYLYGVNRFADDLFFMNGFRLYWIFRILLAFVDPIIILLLFVVRLVNFEHLSTRDGFEWWSDDIALAICFVICLIVPAFFIHALIDFKRKKNFVGAFQPAEGWGPADAHYKVIYQNWIDGWYYEKNPLKQIIFKQAFPQVAPLQDIH